MATFNNIALQEPSTVTARVATVSIARGSTTEQQEILVLGDQVSSLGIARVRDVDPSSTDWALAVRQVGWAPQSTIVSIGAFNSLVSSGVQAGNSSALTVRNVWSSTNADQPVSAAQSGAWSVSVSALPAGSTSVTVGAFGSLVSSNVQAGNSSALTVRNVWSSTNADQPVSAAQSGAWSVSVSALPAGSSGVTVNAFAAGLISSAVSAGNSSALLVRVVGGPSSAGDFVNAVTPIAGSTWRVNPGDTNWASSAGFHFDSSGALQIAGTFSATTSTVVTVSQLLDSSGGSVTAADSANNAIRVNVVAGAAGGSTIVTISTVQGRVGVAPTDTNWASSAGFHFNSSGELNVNATFSPAAGSTTVTINAFAAGLISSAVSAANSSALLVRVVGGVSSGVDFPVRANLSSTGADNPVSVSAMPAGSTTVTIAAFGAGVISSAVAAGNSSALVVRIAGGVSSAGDFLVRPVFSSTGADNPVSVSALPAGSTTITINAFAAGQISSAAAAGNSSALLVRVVGGPSSAGDFVSAVQPIAGSTWRVNPGDTNWASSAGFHFNSSGDLKVELTAASTSVTASFPAGYISSVAQTGNSSGLTVRPVWSSSNADQPVLATIAGNLQSTVPASSNSSGLVVRPVLSNLLTLASSNAFASSLLAINSTATGQKCKVYAYSITSTDGTARKIAFYKGSSMIWPITLAALSSGISGVNFGVSPPAYLFASAAGSSVTIRTPSSIAGFKLAVSYFMEP